MPLDREVDVGPGDIVLHVDPAPPKWHSPQFSARVCCGQTAGWMKIPFGTEVGLGQGNIVLNGDSAPLERGTAPLATFQPMSIVAKWMDGSRCHLIRM